MLEKEEFFKLVPATQNKLRSFMAIMAILLVLQFLTTSHTSILWPIIGIGISLIYLYFSIFITQAPNLYFSLITWIFWLAIIFNGGDILFALFNQEPFGVEIILDLFSIAMVVVFGQSVMRYRRSVREAKKIKSSRSEQ